MRGRKPKPGARAVCIPGNALPRCPPHLDQVARNEWRRLAKPMHDAGVLTIADRAALAAYCQAYSRWVEAEEKLKETPALLKTPSGYVQQSPWLSIANKQLEIMGRYMSELGLTPVARTRLKDQVQMTGSQPDVISVEFVAVERDGDGNLYRVPMNASLEDEKRRARLIDHDEAEEMLRTPVQVRRNV